MAARIAGLNTNASDLAAAGNLENLRSAAAHRDPAAAKATAAQFESLFAQQLIKSMRQTSMGNSMFPSSSQSYRDLYDKEIAKSMTKGKGLGLQPMIRRALGDTGTTTAAPAHSSGGYSLAKYARALPMQKSIPLNTATNAASAASASRQLPPMTVTAPAVQTTPTAAIHAAPTAKPAVSAVRPSSAAPVKTSGTTSPAGSTRSLSQPRAKSDVSSPASTSLGAPSRFTSAEHFVASVWPHAQRAAEKLGVTPQALIAQAALETDWGKHVGGNNNLFGIKASANWHGATKTLPTTEFSNGATHRETASFRSYASVADSFDDFAKMMSSNPRYAAVLGAGSDNARFAHALQQAGYATDPAYAAKITSIANGPVFASVLQNPTGGPLIASK